MILYVSFSLALSVLFLSLGATMLTKNKFVFGTKRLKRAVEKMPHKIKAFGKLYLKFGGFMFFCAFMGLSDLVSGGIKGIAWMIGIIVFGASFFNLCSDLPHDEDM